MEKDIFKAQRRTCGKAGKIQQKKQFFYKYIGLEN